MPLELGVGQCQLVELFGEGRQSVVVAQDVVEVAFASVGLDWRQHVRQDPRFMRPAEPTNLVGDASRARAILGWKPEIGFEQLITEMTSAERAQSGAAA